MTRPGNRPNNRPSTATQIQASDPAIIAPCGINCSLWRAYIRERQPCPGCRGDGGNRSDTCLACAIRNCQDNVGASHGFCFTFDKFPCARLLHLDKRYRTRYGVSVIANLERIQTVGPGDFVAEEAIKWSCPECGTRLCMHRPQCVNYGHVWQGK